MFSGKFGKIFAPRDTIREGTKAKPEVPGGFPRGKCPPVFS